VQFSDVKKIETFTDPAEVNRMLTNGWTLISVDTISDSGYKQFMYVLGWTHHESEEEYLKLKAQYERLGF